MIAQNLLKNTISQLIINLNSFKMKLTNDFFNKAISEIRLVYFPKYIHGLTENKNYHKVNHSLELFSNGCITYNKLIKSLSANCKVGQFEINGILTKYVTDFEGYTFLPK